MVTNAKPKVVWKPLPGSQSLALSCPCDHILYEGTRGPGKTDAQVMFFRKFVGTGYGHFWRGIIFDREYKNLDDLVGKSLRWYPEFQDGAKFLSSKGDYKWVWPTGEQLFFRSIKAKKDYWNYHGQEFPFIGWNELCKYPDPELYDLMQSCNRTSFVAEEHSPTDAKGQIVKMMDPIPLVCFSTTNPYGPGHNWVKRRFIDPTPAGKPSRIVTNVYNPRTRQRENVTKTYVRIFGSYKENRYLTPEYIATLENEKNENRRKAWLHGDWDIVAGGALDDRWEAHVHILPRFPIPENWHVDRSFDWGSTKPFSTGWWAEANGEAVTLEDGRKLHLEAGSIVRIFEYYGTSELGSNVGLKMSPEEVARNIQRLEHKLLVDKWIQQTPWPGAADPAIWTESRGKTGQLESIASRMEQAAGIRWFPCQTGKGSRKNGLELLRQRLENASKREGPGIYFMDNCVATKALLPVLPRSEKDMDDVDTDAEDHLYDETRYRILSGSQKFATDIDVAYPS